MVQVVVLGNSINSYMKTLKYLKAVVLLFTNDQFY